MIPFFWIAAGIEYAARVMLLAQLTKRLPNFIHNGHPYIASAGLNTLLCLQFIPLFIARSLSEAVGASTDIAVSTTTSQASRGVVYLDPITLMSSVAYIALTPLRMTYNAANYVANTSALAPITNALFPHDNIASNIIHLGKNYAGTAAMIGFHGSYIGETINRIAIVNSPNNNPKSTALAILEAVATAAPIVAGIHTASLPTALGYSAVCLPINLACMHYNPNTSPNLNWKFKAVSALNIATSALPIVAACTGSLGGAIGYSVVLALPTRLACASYNKSVVSR